MRSVFALVLIIALATMAIVACSAVPVFGRCDVMLTALPPGTLIDETAPLPADAVVLAGPADFDPDATSLERFEDSFRLSLQLRGDAVGRVAAHTAGHPGDQVAIAINGQVVLVPIIQEPILDGVIEVFPGGLDPDGFEQQFAGCIR